MGLAGLKNHAGFGSVCKVWRKKNTKTNSKWRRVYSGTVGVKSFKMTVLKYWFALPRSTFWEWSNVRKRKGKVFGQMENMLSKYPRKWDTLSSDRKESNSQSCLSHPRTWHHAWHKWNQSLSLYLIVCLEPCYNQKVRRFFFFMGMLSPVFRIVNRSEHSSSSWILDMMTRTRLFLPGRTLQWHSTDEGYSPGKLGDSRIPSPSLV